MLSSIVLAATALAALAPTEAPPWKVNPPIVTVKKELYRQHPRPRAAAMVSLQYVGPKLELREWQGTEVISDVSQEQKARWSLDNGRTWSDFVPLSPSSQVRYGGVTVWEGSGAACFDPRAGVLVEMWLRQIEVGGLYHNFTYCRRSRDLGRTWTAPRQLRYEPGEPFAPGEPLKPAFLQHNQCYPGSNILVLSSGALVHCVAHANAPGDPLNEKRPWKMGALCFIGRWRAEAGDYDWTPGGRIEISPELSARGLMEPEVAELSDGRLLILWRGSNTETTAGRKWFSVSKDGGRTLGEVAEWRYDDGSRFYSPSSYHRMIRHSLTKRLYWLGNICTEPPRGNSPRHPLVIAEVDETIPALKRGTVTAIDDRGPGQGADVQFSNFSLLEDRETHELVLYLTTYGQQQDPRDWATADSYRYSLGLVLRQRSSSARSGAQ